MSSNMWLMIQLGLLNETPIKTVDTEARWVSWLVKTHSCARRLTCPDLMRRSHRSSVFPPKRCPMSLFIGLFLLICILCNKTVIISIVLSWVLWVILATYQTWGSQRNWQVYSQLVRSTGDLETPVVQLAYEISAVVLETVPFNLWGLC